MYLFVRDVLYLVLRPFNALLGAADGDEVRVLLRAGDVDLCRRRQLQVLQAFALRAQNVSVVFLRDRDRCPSLENDIQWN